MISHQHRCIFIHIPKCGGTSIEELIWPPETRSEATLWMGFVAPMRNKYQTGGLQHLCAWQVREEVGAAFDGYFKFAFVRNPWDRLVSQYAYMATRPDLRDYVGLPENASFALYLDRIATREHVQWQKQVSFLRDANGGLLVDFVGRFEALDAGARHVFAKIGLPAQALPHLNRSARGRYQDYYSAETRDLVADRYREDIAAFGYRFEDGADSPA